MDGEAAGGIPGASAYLVPARTRPEISVGQVEILDAEGAKKDALAGRGERAHDVWVAAEPGGVDMRTTYQTSSSSSINVSCGAIVCGNYRTQWERRYVYAESWVLRMV